MLSVDRFSEFFRAVRGHDPFAWQERLVQQVHETGRWPSAVVAPTGAGKTSVIDAHVFLNALGGRVRPPRCLTVTVNRRALVDSHWEHACALQEALKEASDGIVREVAEALQAMRVLGREGFDPLVVARLRGGVDLDAEWRADPTACRVMCATPDMWGSRVLFRGYGTTRRARPVEAGLLAYDSVLVLDEAHLNRQLRRTAAELSRWEPSADGPQPLQVTLATATPDEAFADAVAVTAADLAGSSESAVELRRRMHASKTVSVRVANFSQAKSRAEALVASCRELLKDSPQGTVGCIANTVDVALEVQRQLRAELGSGAVALLVGRMRPYDVARLQAEHPGLLTAEGDAAVKVLVATQTLEVGIDVDLAGLATEVAPGSALAQRFGRVNRRGRLDNASIIVTCPAKAVDIGPYVEADIAAGALWVQGLADGGCGASPWALTQSPPPNESPRRQLWQPLEWHDIEYLAKTSNPLIADEDDLALWLEDRLDAQRDAYVVVRDLPLTDDIAAAMVTDLPPLADEAFKVPLTVAREILGHAPRGLVYRVADTAVVDRASLAPGDFVVIPPGVPVSGLSQDGAVQSVWQECVGDAAASVVVSGSAVNGDEPEGTRESRVSRAIRAAIGFMAQKLGRLTAAQRETVAGLLTQVSDAQPLCLLLREAPLSVDIFARFDEETGSGYLAAVRRRKLDTFGAEAWSRDCVELASHQQAVAERAREIAGELGFAPSTVAALEDAGMLHDEGKRDSRFQRALGRHEDGPLLAKSGVAVSPSGVKRSTSRAERLRLLAAVGLPQGWRHEQLSAAYAWAHQIEARELVTRLVGTSHGCGRGCFDANAADLLGAAEHPDEVGQAARELFDEGRWDQLVERLDQEDGPWRMAYLEAVLRAADQSVSGEGR